MGYHRAFPDAEIVGVDIAAKPLRHYPFTAIQGDALNPPVNLDVFDLIHASPPCQSYSRAAPLSHGAPMLIDDIRDILIGRTYVIENVEGAPLPHQDTLDGTHGVKLCGSMFGLRVQRHRLFETSFPVPHGWCNHAPVNIDPFSPRARNPHLNEPVEEAFRKELGLSWMPQRHARQSFPIQYTEYIGTHL